MASRLRSTTNERETGADPPEIKGGSCRPARPRVMKKEHSTPPPGAKGRASHKKKSEKQGREGGLCTDS